MCSFSFIYRCLWYCLGFVWGTLGWLAGRLLGWAFRWGSLRFLLRSLVSMSNNNAICMQGHFGTVLKAKRGRLVAHQGDIIVGIWVVFAWLLRSVLFLRNQQNLVPLCLHYTFRYVSCKFWGLSCVHITSIRGRYPWRGDAANAFSYADTGLYATPSQLFHGIRSE